MVVIAVAAFVVIAGFTRLSRSSDGRGGSELAVMVDRYDAALIEHDWAALEGLLASDASIHDVDLELTQDRVGFLAWARIIAESYPNYAVSIDDVRFDGEVATVRFHENTDGVEGIRTPSSVAESGVVVVRVVDERIVELWSNYDEFGLLHQRTVSSGTSG